MKEAGEKKKKEKRKHGSYHFIRQAGVRFTSATQTTQGIKHAWAEEANEGDHAELDARRGIPAGRELADGARLVHPSCGSRDGLSRCDW